MGRRDGAKLGKYQGIFGVADKVRWVGERGPSCENIREVLGSTKEVMQSADNDRIT